jgi:CBS domain-containing protein
MQVFEAMTPDVISVPPDTTLKDAALAMRILDVGPLPVVEAGHMVGVITDRDITVRATASGLDPRTTPVRDVMTATVVACREDDDLQSAVRLMQAAQLRRLMVVDGTGHLVGIVSLGDLALQACDDRLAGETLERVSETRIEAPTSVPEPAKVDTAHCF